jgi:hypothetical protein
MSFKIRDLTADVLPLRAAGCTCANSGAGGGNDDEDCGHPSCGQGSDRPCAHGSRGDDRRTRGYDALSALRRQLHDTLSAQI